MDQYGRTDGTVCSDEVCASIRTIPTWSLFLMGVDMVILQCPDRSEEVDAGLKGAFAFYRRNLMKAGNGSICLTG
jgi:hypothetical protein